MRNESVSSYNLRAFLCSETLDGSSKSRDKQGPICTVHDVSRSRLAVHDTAVMTSLLLLARLEETKTFLKLLMILNLKLIHETIRVLVAMGRNSIY